MLAVEQLLGEQVAEQMLCEAAQGHEQQVLHSMPQEVDRKHGEQVLHSCRVSE